MVESFKISTIYGLLDLLTKDIVTYFNHLKVYLKELFIAKSFLGYEQRGIEVVR
jgi:hypothetical protein